MLFVTFVVRSPFLFGCGFAAPGRVVALLSRAVTEENVFRPFLKIQGHSIGLSMVLAQQILARRDGKILFEKQTKSPARFTIFLRVNRISDYGS